MTKLKALRLFIGQVLRFSPVYFFISIAKGIVEVIRTLLFIYIPKLLIDIAVKNKDSVEIRNTLLYISLFTIVLYFLETLLNTEISIKSEENKNTFKEKIATKIMKLEYHHLEDPYYLDLRERIMMVIMNFNVIESLMNSLRETFFFITLISGLSVIIFRLSPLLFLFLISIQIVNIAAVSYRNIKAKKTMDENVSGNRKYGALMNLVLDRRNTKDIRVYGLGDLYISEIKKYNRIILDGFIKLGMTEAMVNSIIAAVNYTVTSVTIIYSGLRVLSDRLGPKIGIGDFSLYLNASVKFSEGIRKVMESYSTTMINLHYIIPFEELMLLNERKEEQNKLSFNDNIDTIEFKNVSFKYPKDKSYILKNISFKINKNEKISIVGLNGAGKTTLIKLICGLFPVSDGEILVNGINIGNYDYDTYINKLSTIFQDFKMYKMSILENIIKGEKEELNGLEDIGAVKKEKLYDLIKEVEMDEVIGKLPKGFNSVLGIDYEKDGVDLSGGQLQKLSIVRALMKDSDLVIMDEPTSALDPLAEAKIYEHFNKLAKDKTVIYISHRMSSSVFCDRILLINNGEVEAFDSHENLMKNEKGLYYSLFKTQADNYTNG